MKHWQRLSEPAQSPSAQTSPPVHGFRSSQGAVLAVKAHSPVASTQASSVQGLPSSQVLAGVLVQTPFAHWNELHGVQSPSRQAAPSSTLIGTQEPASLHAPRSQSPTSRSHSAPVGALTTSHFPARQATCSHLAGSTLTLPSHSWT